MLAWLILVTRNSSAQLSLENVEVKNPYHGQISNQPAFVDCRGHVPRVEGDTVYGATAKAANLWLGSTYNILKPQEVLSKSCTRFSEHPTQLVDELWSFMTDTSQLGDGIFPKQFCLPTSDMFICGFWRKTF